MLFYSASTAEQDISPGLEIVENLDASGAIDGNEGRLTTPTDLAQAIVADREFIAKISSAIWANIAPNLNLSNVTGSNPNASAVPEGQAEELNPGVSVDQINGYKRKLCNCQSPSISASIGSREENFGSKYRFRNAG